MLEARLWAALEEVSGQPHIARGEEGGGVECVLELPGVPQLEGRSFQHLLVPQPVKLGGCNLRSLVETRFPAFIGGLEQALHFMVVGDKQEKVVSPILREAVGGMEGQQRWVEFLAADSRTARSSGRPGLPCRRRLQPRGLTWKWSPVGRYQLPWRRWEGAVWMGAPDLA